MKSLILLAALTLIAGVVKPSQAQVMGHPFNYSVSGAFVDGEPDTNYTAGQYGTAWAIVGVGAVFTVQNPTANTFVSFANYWSISYANDILGNTYLGGGSGTLYEAGEIDALQEVSFYANDSTGGSLAPGAFTAEASFVISATNSDDFDTLSLSFPFIVNPPQQQH